MSGHGRGVRRVHLSREQGFRFRARFGAHGISELVTDEPPPLGSGAGPDPSELLAAAVANCLASSLLFCMQRARLEVQGLEVDVATTLTRNEQGRRRIGEVRVCLAPTVTPEVRDRMGRCVELFESFCVVTESVRRGVSIRVAVEPRAPSVPGLGEIEHAPCALIGDA